VIGRQVGACDPKPCVGHERPKGPNDELTLRAPPEWLERAIELFPASRQRADALLRDRHVRLEGARRHARVVIVVDAHAMLFFRLAICL